MNPECMITALERMVEQGFYIDMEEAINSIFDDRQIVNETHRPGREKLKADRVVKRIYGRTKGGDIVANQWCRWSNKPRVEKKESRPITQTEELTELYRRILES